MAIPIISGITVTPDPVPVGGQATITVAAYDPDGREIVAEATVTDSSGQVATTAFTFVVSDGLTYTASVDAGVVVQDPTDPTRFVWSAA